MLRIAKLQNCAHATLVTSGTGDWAIVPTGQAEALVKGRLSPSHPPYEDLYALGLVREAGDEGLRRLEVAIQRTRKSFLLDGPSLHIFVVTLRCDHSCQYCQVSRAAVDASGYDMDEATAIAGVDRVFDSPSQHITIEFQGGEPALRFDLVKLIVELAEARNASEGRLLRFTMATTLHLLGHEELEFCRDHQIHLSTSIDGVAEIHNAQRPNPTRSSHQQTIDGLVRARAIVGDGGVAALPTITRRALQRPKALIDTYRQLGFSSIFLRPLSPFGFALKTRRSLGYSMTEFLKFYEQSLEYILALNAAGESFEETTAAVMLRHILTPFHSGYSDLRSPSAAGIGVLVYNYDGQAYPTDEARMAAETGDHRFALGPVTAPLQELLSSPAMVWLSKGAIAEVQPDCANCAYVPYCGADPVHHATTQGEPDAPRLGSEFCDKHKGIFEILFRYLAEGDPEVRKTFEAWALRKPRSEISSRSRPLL